MSEHRWPTGTVAFLFSDIEGSTSRWDRTPEAMTLALRRHDALLHAAISDNGGAVFKTIGDAFCAAFPRACDAVAAAAAAQRTIAKEDFADVGGLRVRIAIHVGSADERDRDYFGPAVNRVARLLAIGHGGQTLLSGLATELAAPLPPGLALVDLGTHRLKDLAQPEHVFALTGDGLFGEFPPLRSLDAPKNTLPAQLTRLIGREREVAELRTLFAQHRLVTLTGTGGVGKTRCALEAASGVAASFADGASLIELAAVHDPAFVASAFSAALHIAQPAAGTVIECVLSELKRRECLLVVDNCEHVIDECARVVDAILRSCPGVRIVATSREPFNITGEFRYEMPTLDVPPNPPAGARLTTEDALSYSGVRLFVERASAVDRRFSCTDENASAIADICRRLDGIALAIELAAARVNVLAPHVLATRLNERFALLTDGSRTGEPRQRTMLALIGWSYDLLERDEREIFAKLSIFSGSWTLAAAQAIASGDERTAGRLFDTIAALQKKSLVAVDGDDATRFRFMESIRAFAALKLDESGVRSEIARRHAEWVHSIVDPPATDDKLVHRWLASVVPETGNVRAALGWLLGDGNDPGYAGAIAGKSLPLWYDAGLRADGLHFVENALNRLGDEDGIVTADLWYALAGITIGPKAVEASRRALAMFESLGDATRAARSAVSLGYALYEAGKPLEAERALDRALEFYRSSPEEQRTQSYANALSTRAVLRVGRCSADDVCAEYEAAISIFTEIGDELGAAIAGGNLAELEFFRGRTERAIELAASASVVFQRYHSRSREATALVNGAAYHLALGNVDEAASTAAAALRIARRSDDEQIGVIAIGHLATVAALRGEGNVAARLIGYVDAWYARAGLSREWSERRSLEMLTEAQSILEPADRSHSYAAGTDISADEASAEALAFASQPFARSRGF